MNDDLRVLLAADAFCPNCGHNRDASIVSSVDEGGGVKSCQMCGIAWRELPDAAGADSIDKGNPAPTAGAAPSDAPRFASVSCSQCGEEFGPGNAGYSHCHEHTESPAAPAAAAPVVALRDALEEIVLSIEGGGNIVTFSQRDLERYRAALTATPPAPVQPAGEVQPVAMEGWRMVPVEPTEEMVEAAIRAVGASNIGTVIHAHRAMLDAAPVKEAAAPVQMMQGLAEFLRGLRSHSLYANASEKRRANISRWISEVEAARAAAAIGEKEKGG